jgi:hypothetical protein
MRVPRQIVPERLRTFIYSFDRSFEMAVAATSAPLVGLLAERLGFDVRPPLAVPIIKPWARIRKPVLACYQRAASLTTNADQVRTCRVLVSGCDWYAQKERQRQCGRKAQHFKSLTL